MVAAQQNRSSACFHYAADIEAEIEHLCHAIEALPTLATIYPPRWLAVQLLEGDESIEERVRCFPNADTINAAYDYVAGWLASTPGEALTGARQLVAEVVHDLETSGEPVPEPFSTRSFSGRFFVCIPPERHRRLAIEAAEAGISLNRLASDKLSRVDA